MAIEQKIMEQALMERFPDSKFSLQDTAGDMNHYELSIYCPSLTGSLRDKHRAIYEAIYSYVGELPHALSINIIVEDNKI